MRALTHTLLLAALLIALPHAGQAGNFGRPSNPAGVWEMTIGPGTHFLSFPVLPRQANPNALFGDHFPGGIVWDSATRILTYEDGELLGSFYNSLTEQWEGTLDTLKLERAYWLIVPDDADPLLLRLVGGALTMEEFEVDVLDPGVHALACPAIVPVTLAGSGLTESGWVSDEYRVRADRIYTFADDELLMTWHSPDEGWTGAPFTFEPGQGYLLERLAGRSPIPWTRPALTVGAEPPEIIRPEAGTQPGQLSVPFDLDTPPWEGNRPAPKETARPTTSRDRGGRVDR